MPTPITLWDTLALAAVLVLAAGPTSLLGAIIVFTACALLPLLQS